MSEDKQAELTRMDSDDMITTREEECDRCGGRLGREWTEIPDGTGGDEWVCHVCLPPERKYGSE